MDGPVLDFEFKLFHLVCGQNFAPFSPLEQKQMRL